MDRLHTVIVAFALFAGCAKEGSGEEGKPAEGEGRINAVETVAKKEVSVEEFCDVHKSAAEASPLVVPPLSGTSAPPPGGKWRWFNVWATWCQPCIEEMPLLTAWQKQLAGEGLTVELVFVSADESDELVEAYRKSHPQTPPSLRLEKSDSLQSWLENIGVGANAPIPIHLLVDPSSKVRCVRAGQVKESDLPAIRSLLKSS